VAGFITSDGAVYLARLATQRVLPPAQYWLTLTRSVPAPFLSTEELDEIDAPDYARAPIAADGLSWAASGTTVANTVEVLWGVPGADWGDVQGWALLDSPQGGSVLYGGDLGITWTIGAGMQPVMAPGQLNLSITVSSWALEI